MDSYLSSILGPVCQRLLDAAIEEYRLVRGVKEEIRNLRTTVSMIKGVLEDAERKKVENDAIRIWLKSLKQVLFDAEDVFDEIATEEALERDAKDGTTQSAIITRRLSKVLKLKSYTLLGALSPSTSALVNSRQLITATVVVAKKIISLKTLVAESCSPKQIATWLRQVSSLQVLRISSCPQLSCFGAGGDDSINGGDLDRDRDLDLDMEGALLDLAPSLRELEISNCENLSSLPSKLRSLTRLETLTIRCCPKIQRLPSAGLPQTLKQLLFPRLRTLELSSCEKLRELPPLPPTLTSLRLDRVGLTRLPGWMERCSDDDIGRADVVMMPASFSTSTSSSSSLSTLYINSCPNITSLGDGLRSLGGAAGLVSLEELTISNCPKLLHLVEEGGGAAAAVMSSPPVIIPSSSTVVVAKKITSLNTLRAWSCSPKQIATWLRQVSSLQELEIWGFGAGDDDSINARDLDQDLDLEGALLDLAPSLRKLTLDGCENLSSLPSKLRSLTRLQRLEITYCPKIQRLPSAGLPQTLKELVINGCPELEQRCREEGCPDWPLISHIPHVQIGD